MGHGLAAAMEAVLTGISGMLSLNFCSLSSCCHVYGAFVAAVATVVSVLAFGPAFNWLSVFFFFSLFELNRILIVVLGRPHFRSQVEFCGLCSSLTFGSSPRLSGYDGALHPRIVDIFVLEHCCAVVAAVEPSVVQRGRGG